MARYVRYTNDPNGKKWTLGEGTYNDDAQQTDWHVIDNGRFYFLPKSDYVLLKPERGWKDVTATCRVDAQRLTLPSDVHLILPVGYRWINSYHTVLGYTLQIEQLQER